jgi:endonuclease/exonuclease/phosphatase family metal-dependent hydrolase
MARRLLGALAVLLAACAPRASGDEAVTSSGATDTIRILTYNIHHGAGTDDRLDLARLAGVIRAQRPHLVALQEVDSATNRTGRVDQATALGNLAGMRAYFAKAMDYDGGGYGEALLVGLSVETLRTHPLPADSGYEPRAVAEAVVRLPRTGRPLVFLGTHLDHTENAAMRRMQVDSIVRLFVTGPNAPDAPIVLVGDLNATPGSPPMETLTRHFGDAGASANASTYPSDAPEKRIDYVLLRPESRFKVLEMRVIDERVASDHRPVLTVIEIRQ